MVTWEITTVKLTCMLCKMKIGLYILVEQMVSKKGDKICRANDRIKLPITYVVTYVVAGLAAQDNVKKPKKNPKHCSKFP